MKSNLKIILVLLIIGEIFSVRMMYKSYNNETIKENVEEIPKKQFAIKVDNGSGKYEDSTSFPGKGYYLNMSLTECKDQMGNKVSNVKIESNGTNVTVTSKYTVFCTLYFKFKSILDILRENDTSNKLSNNLVGGMYRYQGIDNVNNWICFGTSKDCSKTKEDINKYMYRIIGVTPEGELALLKETKVKEETTPFQWNDKVSITDCGSNGEYCTWNTSKLYNRLNGLCKTGNANCDGTETNIFINSNYYEYLTNGSVWLDKISNHAWKYGDSKELNSYNGDSAYSIESQFPNSIEAKIGLQYVHDYYYAYPGGNPGSADSAKNAWIHLSKDGISEMMYEWLISKDDIDNSLVYSWILFSDGNVTRSSLSNYINVRPVFYLTPDIALKKGTTGTKDNPYIIDI